MGLFAGIGGIELGFARAGHRTTLLCDIDPAARAVLARRFPGIPLVDDVRSIRRLPKGTQLVSAGFPCQDLSQAGRTAGINGSRSRLVAQVFRLLEEDRVPWVLLENVPFMRHLDNGRAMRYVVNRFERLGYRWAYRTVDTRAFGLPQRRERIFLLASLVGDPRRVMFADDAEMPHRTEASISPRRGYGFYWTEGWRGLGWAEDAVPTLKGGSACGVPSPPAVLLPSGWIVRPDIRAAERLQGFPADWTRPAESVAKPGVRWRLVGNAVSVPVARWIGRRLASPADLEDLVVERLTTRQPWPRSAWNVGDGRFEVRASTFPKRWTQRSVLEFVDSSSEPLSVRASAGFLDRIRSSSLRLPDGFEAAVARHVREMRRTTTRSRA